MRFKTKVQLLQSTQELQELKLKEYRTFVKCFLGEENDPEVTFLNAKEVIRKCCKINKNKIDKLNFIDFMLLMFYIRSISIGDLAVLYANNDDDQQLKIELSLNSINNLIYDIVPRSYFDPQKIENVTILYQLPTIQEILYFENNNDISIPTFFVQSVNINNLTINLNDYSYQDREKIIKQLPVKVALQIDKYVYKLFDLFKTTNLLQNLQSEKFNKTLPFTANSEILSFIIKIIYNTDLENIYNGLFVLSKAANLNSAFLDNCSPGEFFLFAKKFEEANQQNTKDNRDSSNYTEDDLPPIVSEGGFDDSLE